MDIEIQLNKVKGYRTTPHALVYFKGKWTLDSYSIHHYFLHFVAELKKVQVSGGKLYFNFRISRYLAAHNTKLPNKMRGGLGAV